MGCVELVPTVATYRAVRSAGCAPSSQSQVKSRHKLGGGRRLLVRSRFEPAQAPARRALSVRVPVSCGAARKAKRKSRPRRVVTRGATSYEVASPSTFVYLPYTSYKNRCLRRPSPALLVLRLVQLCSVISTVPYIALHPNARGHPIVQERCRARKSRGLPANLQADLKLTTCLASTEQPSRRADSPPRAAHGIMAERRSVRRAGERCCETGWRTL